MLYKRILVVDDEREIRRLVMSRLSSDGHLVQEAASGAEAFEKAEKSGFDLLIVDIKMPDISGDELISKIREFDKRTKIIVMSAHGDPNVLKKVMSLGISKWIVKPFKPMQMSELVRDVLAS